MPVSYSHFAPEWRSRHSAQDALALGLACKLVYEKDWKKVRAQLARWGFPKSRRIHVRKGGDIDTQAFVAGGNGVVLVAFRGSDSRRDWIANLQAVRDPGPLTRTKVHEGFQDALFPAAVPVDDAIEGVGGAGQPVWVTGHSLGGALASLFTGMLLEHGAKVGGLYTFAAPRVGNDRFMAALNAGMQGRPHFRYANENDLVPHVPPEPFFHHTGQRRLLRARGKAETSRSAWIRFKTTFVKWFNEVTDGDLVVKEAHLIDSKKGYLPRLLREARRR